MTLSVCFCTDASCDDSFQLNSQCYKVHKNEKVSWFTAVNRCISNNASLAVFDDDVYEYFPSSVLSDYAWIGLVKSWWTWPDLGKFQLVLRTFKFRPPRQTPIVLFFLWNHKFPRPLIGLIKCTPENGSFASSQK